jgi:iron-sulfur cluster assembly accessory protein
METINPPQPVIGLTPSAADEVRALLEKPENAGKLLRVYVEQGGCSGMQYSMVFDERRPDDLATEINGVSILVDPFSAKYLRGSVVDFSDSLNAGGFKVTNPNAAQSCGCGKSFTA